MGLLKGYSTTAPNNIDRDVIKGELKKMQERLFNVQHLLHANSQHSLLIILQGLDASGKDSTIRHVFSCVNPMGCNVKSFIAPTVEEKRHGFLWRIHKHLPPKGMIQIFNRSHYEDILVPTVYNSIPADYIEQRFDYINSFEKDLQRNGTIILKFFLNISEEAQEAKLKRRLSDPQRKWKYDRADEIEKKNRRAYLKVYRKIFKRCSPNIPWTIIPADQKWYRNYLIAQSVLGKLESLGMTYPV